MDTLFEIAISAALMSTCALGFHYVRISTANIDFTPVAASGIAAYLTSVSLGLSGLVAITTCTVVAALLSACLYYGIQRFLEKDSRPGPLSFLSGLGLLSAAQGITGLFYKSSTISICSFPSPDEIPRVRLYAAILCIFATIAGAVFLEKTLLGARIRAVGSDPQLALIHDILPTRTRLCAYFISAALLALAATTIAVDSNLSTDRIMIIGLDGLIGCVLIGSVLGTLQTASCAILGGAIWGATTYLAPDVKLRIMALVGLVAITCIRPNGSFTFSIQTRPG